VTEEEPDRLLTDEELDELAFQIPHVKAWVNAVERELFRAMEAGVEFKNAKLEPKRALRKWTLDPAAMIKRLRKIGKLDTVAPRVPLSPAQLEKELGRVKYREFAATEVDGARIVIAQSSGMKVAYTHPAGEDDE